VLLAEVPRTLTNVALGSYADPTLIQAYYFQGMQGQFYSKSSYQTAVEPELAPQNH